MAKKYLALLLAVVLVIGLAACSSGKSTESGTSKTEAPAKADSSEKNESSTKAEADPAEEKLDYVKLKFIAVGDATADEERIVEKINELLLEDLNCELEMEWISWADWSTKYSLIFSGGEEFDMVFSARWADYIGHAHKGAFYPLSEEELQKYMPKTWANVTEAQWQQARVDGTVYMLPMSASGYYSDYYCYIVRGDLLKEFGMDGISSTEDMLRYWDNVVEKHPEMIPIDVNSAEDGKYGLRVVQSFVENPIATYNGNFVTTFTGTNQSLIGNIPMSIDCRDKTNPKLVDQETVDEYLLSLFRKCKEFYEKGYWSADALTRADMPNVAFVSGQGASSVGHLLQCETAYTSVMGAHPEWEPKIVRVRSDPFIAMLAHSNGMSINANTKHPERAMMVLDLLGYDSRYYDLMYYGIEGEHYTLTEDGKVESIAPFAGTSMNMGFVNTTERVVATASKEYIELRAWGADHVQHPLTDSFTFDTSGLQTEQAALSQVASRYNPLLCLGMCDDIEATYYEFVEQAEAAGARTIQDEFMKQFLESLNVS